MRTLFRRIGIITLGLSTVMVVPTAVAAAAPSNDLYANATAITSLPYSEAVDLTDATDDPGFPPCEAGAHRRIWYTFTPSTDDAIRVSVAGDTTAELALWTVTGPPPGGVDLVACAVGGRDLVRQLVSGQEYAISVGQWVIADPMIANLTIAVQPAPANDDFGDAADVGAPPFNAGLSIEEAYAATAQADEPTPDCLINLAPEATVWYRFSSADGAHVNLSAGPIATAAVFQGDALDTLTEVACTDSGTTSFDAAPGETYYIQFIAARFRDSTLAMDWATPPTNDDFSDSILLTDLSNPVTADLTAASVEADEPTPSCAPGRVQTAWWSFTAPDDGVLTVSGSSPFWAAYTGTTLAGLSEIACQGSGTTFPLILTAGQTAHLQVGETSPGPGSGSLQMSFVASPDNDDFADAIRVVVGDDKAIDRSGATVESGEPNPPTCGFAPGASVWYDFIGTGQSVSFGLDSGSYSWAIAAYSGSSVDGLTELGCRQFDGPPLTIRPAAGEHVRLQVWSYDYCCTSTTALHVTLPGDPVPAFGMSFGDPSTLDDVTFFDQTTDPGGNPIVAWHWDFGGGVTSDDQFATHRFATDGDHHVSLTVTTSDGRTATGTQTVTVRTHDVGVGKLTVPSTAKVGQTKQIVVGIGNRRYPESVTVQLQVSRPGGAWQEVGVVNRDIAVLGKNKTVDVTFDYRFVAADGTAGKVTFRAVVTLASVRDALPTDNEAISIATRVTK
jgi:hypothetical protein